MRSLRAKLFLSMGSILLLVALLSYLIPIFFIRKDIASASSYLTAVYKGYIEKINYLSKNLVTYRFIHTAAELDAIAQTVRIENKSSWEIAASILTQDPELAVVQVTSEDGKVAVLQPESAKSHTPLWAKDSQEQLWIKIPGKEQIFLASPLDQQGYYLLKEKTSADATLHFTPFEAEEPIRSYSDPTEDIYQTLRTNESNLLQKVRMIKLLAPWEERAGGILHTDSAFRKGVALLSDEIFSTLPIATSDHEPHTPFVIFRQEGPYVDLVQSTPPSEKGGPVVLMGYSLSNIACEIAKTLQKPVLLNYKGENLQGFTPNGENLLLQKLQKQEGDSIQLQGVNYFLFSVPLEKLTFSILIPESEKFAIQRFLHQVGDSLIAKISLNLLTIALLLLGLSLFFLARISKRITKPIRQLALASEEIGKGKYGELDLPPVEKRRDEVATLSHSFQKMVLSLRDREKIRGVLNKVVSKEIASKILNSSIELGGEERRLTMLFSDIRGFTPLSETLTPPQLISLLNSYMTRMCRIIDETHGVVDKFVGDEIMALYGAPIDLDNHADKAIEAALFMIAELKRWNQERVEGEPHISVGIGIHTGIAFAGNMGADDRLNYTVVGANVNLAARLCSAAKPMQILISEATYNSLQNPQLFHFEKLEPIRLKGIDDPVPIYAASTVDTR